jgi:hypothetical protein
MTETDDTPAVYVTYQDCTCADCSNPACALYEREMFWDSPRGTGLAPICPVCGEPGQRPDCMGCLDGAAEYRDDLPFIPCTIQDGTCIACGNFCQCRTCTRRG